MSSAAKKAWATRRGRRLKGAGSCAGCNSPFPKKKLISYKGQKWCRGCYEDMGKCEGGYVFKMPKPHLGAFRRSRK